MCAADPFYRNPTERANHESFWKGYADGLDEAGASRWYLCAEGSIYRNYIDGYQNGFYDRKRRDTHTHEQLTLATYMGAPRARLERLRGVRWANYTRGGK